MPVEYFIRQDPQYAHEEQASLKLAQLMERAFAASERFYLLAINLRFWRAQVDALVLAPNAVTLVELKSCADPVYGRAHGSWRAIPSSQKLPGGSQANPYQQIVATREKLIKYLDRNRRRFLLDDRESDMAGQWGQVSAALVFSPRLHPDSDVVVPPESRAWLGVLGLNEVVEFVFSRVSPQIDLRPQELRRLATEAFHCRPWDEIQTLLPASPSYGHLWLLDETGQRAYAFPVVDRATIGRSRDNTLVIPRRCSRTSRHHAHLRVMGKAVWLYDDGSTHGTFINGEKVPAERGQLLHDGDRIVLGDPDHDQSCLLCFERELRPGLTTQPTATTRP